VLPFSHRSCAAQGSLIYGKSRRCRLGHVISCVQSQLITWDMYTDHQGTDDQCALMISVAPEVPSVLPVSASQCRLSVCISAAYQCPSVPPISASQCPPNSASQCRLSVLLFSAHQ
ncbi:unnamed protein product, partial [Staurois parvus]